MEKIADNQSMDVLSLKQYPLKSLSFSADNADKILGLRTSQKADSVRTADKPGQKPGQHKGNKNAGFFNRGQVADNSSPAADKFARVYRTRALSEGPLSSWQILFSRPAGPCFFLPQQKLAQIAVPLAAVASGAAGGQTIRRSSR